MIKTTTLILTALLLVGCGHAFYPKCRHKAVLAGITVAEYGYPVRIVSGTTKDGRHAQAQAFIDSRWQWLRVGDRWEVYTTGMDNFMPDQTWTVNDYYESRFSDIVDRMSE